MNNHKPSRATICFALILFGALALTTPEASALYSTSQVAWPGRPVAAVTGWPEGVLDLVNDPLRTDGWNPWFSELSNDVNDYEYKIRDTEDVNRLLKSLAAIKVTNVTLRLNPGNGRPRLDSGRKTSGNNQTAVVFSVGNQARLDEWFQLLPEVEPGVRGFGRWRSKEAPVALPPTLTIYVGHEAVDLNKLKIPDAVEVVSDAASATKAPEQEVKAIEEFIAKRKSRSAPSDPVVTVRGVVTDENGAPLADVKLQVCGAEKDQDGVWNRQLSTVIFPSYSTDKEGRFALPFHYADTRYDLYFDKYGFAPTFLYGISNQSPELSVVLKRGITVTGTVKRTVGTQREPVRGTTVELRLPYVDLWYQQRAITDHEGKYMFHVTPPPPGREWQVMFAGEVVQLDVNSTWSAGPDFEVTVQVRNSNQTSSTPAGER